MLVTADVDEEEVGRIMTKYDLLALPVVDEQQRLLGIVTLDDALEAVVPDDWKQRLPRCTGRRLGSVGPSASSRLRAGRRVTLFPGGVRRGGLYQRRQVRRKRATSPFSCTRRKPPPSSTSGLNRLHCLK